MSDKVHGQCPQGRATFHLVARSGVPFCPVVVLGSRRDRRHPASQLRLGAGTRWPTFFFWPFFALPPFFSWSRVHTLGQLEPTRRSARNAGKAGVALGGVGGEDDSLGGAEGGEELAEFDVDEENKKQKKRAATKKVVPQASGVTSSPAGKPKIDPSDKKRGRPSKEIHWDEHYTGPLRRCAYIGHEELWGPDVPADLQPQYFYATTARCIYCYKHLCNERHANKSKGGSAGKKKTGAGGGSRGRRRAKPDDDDDDEDDDRVTPTSKRGRSASARSKRSKEGDDDGDNWASSPRRPTPSQPRPVPVAVGQGNPPPNVLHNAETAQRHWVDGPRILQEWDSPAVGVADETTAASALGGAGPLELKTGAIPQRLEAGHALAHGTTSLLLNASPLASCVGWVSSDMLVVGGGNTLHVWSGLSQGGPQGAPKLLYALLLEGGTVHSFIVLPRSNVPKVRYAAVAAVHTDGRVRLHSLPVVAPAGESFVLRQEGCSPVSVPGTAAVQSLAISSHPSHPNRLILGHADGSLRWVDLPSNPGPQLPPPEGHGGAGFSIAAAGYLPTSDAAFWAVGDSASVAIGDIREPFGGPTAPPAQAGHTESFLKTADSSVVFPALVAGGDGGHVWALPWAGEHTPPPRLLCSLNGAALAIKCHPFLPLAITGCASGAARALWLPPGAHKSQQQLIIHAASAEDHLIVVDSPADLNDQGFKHAGTLACVSAAWAPDLDGKYAVAHSGGLVRVGNVREFILRSAAK